MSQTLQRIRELAAHGDVKISAHGYDELAADGLLVKEILAGVEEAVMVEDYPDYPKGPVCWCCSGMLTVSPSMSYGGFPSRRPRLQWW